MGIYPESLVSLSVRLILLRLFFLPLCECYIIKIDQELKL